MFYSSGLVKLLNFFPIIAPFNQVPLEFFQVMFIVRGSGANLPQPKGLAESDTVLVLRKMATVLMEVPMGGCRLGIKICNQLNSVSNNFNV